jgi:hypothetical protein
LNQGRYPLFQRPGEGCASMSVLPPDDFSARLVPIEVDYHGRHYRGEGIPVPRSLRDEVYFELDLVLNDEYLGRIHHEPAGWKMDTVKDQELVDALGEKIAQWYE